MRSAIVVGNPKPQSRTWLAAHRVLRELTGGEPDVAIDLTELGAGLLDWTSTAVGQAVEQIIASELVIIATPTYKGSYTGLLKLFLDRFSAGSLIGVTAVPLMLGAHWRHAMAGEVFLKPVLNEIGLSTPTSALYLLDNDWDSPGVLDGWLAPARGQLGLIGVS